MAHVDSNSSLDPTSVGRHAAPPLRPVYVIVTVALGIAAIAVYFAGLFGLVVYWPSIQSTLDGMSRTDWGILWIVFLLWVLAKSQERAEKERAEILRLLRGLQATVDRQRL